MPLQLRASCRSGGRLRATITWRAPVMGPSRLIRHLKKRRLIGSSDSSHKSNDSLGVLNCYGPKFRRRHRIWHLKEATTTHQKQRQLTWRAHALGPSDDRIRHQKEETTWWEISPSAALKTEERAASGESAPQIKVRQRRGRAGHNSPRSQSNM